MDKVLLTIKKKFTAMCMASNIIFDVRIPDEKRTTRDSRFEDLESIKLRNELLRQINQDVEAHVQIVQ